MFVFVSTDTTPESALDSPVRDSAPESSYSPATVDQALAIAYGFNTAAPTRDHLLALIEHYGITQSVTSAEAF